MQMRTDRKPNMFQGSHSLLSKHNHYYSSNGRWAAATSSRHRWYGPPGRHGERSSTVTAVLWDGRPALCFPILSTVECSNYHHSSQTTPRVWSVPLCDASLLPREGNDIPVTSLQETYTLLNRVREEKGKARPQSLRECKKSELFWGSEKAIQSQASTMPVIPPNKVLGRFMSPW